MTSKILVKNKVKELLRENPIRSVKEYLNIFNVSRNFYYTNLKKLIIESTNELELEI